MFGHFLLEQGLELELEAEMGEIMDFIDRDMPNFVCGEYGYNAAIHITAQNHGYAVDANTLPRGLEVSHVNLNDGTVEGLVHLEMPIMTIQYHSEASPGPRDNEYLFDRFLAMVGAQNEKNGASSLLEGSTPKRAQ